MAAARTSVFFGAAMLMPSLYNPPGLGPNAETSLPLTGHRNASAFRGGGSIGGGETPRLLPCLGGAAGRLLTLLDGADPAASFAGEDDLALAVRRAGAGRGEAAIPSDAGRRSLWPTTILKGGRISLDLIRFRMPTS